MGFSLHLARTRETIDEVTTGIRSSNPPKEVTAEGVASALSKTDYIKVYHEAKKSMFLRTALDLWAYEQGEGKAKEKVRVLKGAKLVMVDHLSTGVLIS
jgi:hypothetical protein